MKKLTETKESFVQAGYSLVPELVVEPVRSFLYEYALKSAQAGRLNFEDSGVPNTPSYYSDAFMDALLELSLPRMEAESGMRLFPTYSYFRVYKHGDVLERHQDRPSCEISATLSLGYDAAEPWPIWIETGGAIKSISLEPGSAMIYKGIQIPHWRESFPGRHSAQVFLHYVNQNGPHKDKIFDGRERLASSPVALQLLRHLMGTFEK